MSFIFADFLFTPNINASLGTNSLGQNPLGLGGSEPDDKPKYRRIKPIVADDFFECQCGYEQDESDGQLQIVAHGPELLLSSNIPQRITK